MNSGIPFCSFIAFFFSCLNFGFTRSWQQLLMAKHEIVSRCSQDVTSNTTCAFVVHWAVKERYTSKAPLSAMSRVETNVQRSVAVCTTRRHRISLIQRRTQLLSDVIWKGLLFLLVWLHLAAEHLQACKSWRGARINLGTESEGHVKRSKRMNIWTLLRLSLTLFHCSCSTEEGRPEVHTGSLVSVDL